MFLLLLMISTRLAHTQSHTETPRDPAQRPEGPQPTCDHSDSDTLQLRLVYEKTRLFEPIRGKRSPDQKSKRKRKARDKQASVVEELIKKKENLLVELTKSVLNSDKRQNITDMTKGQIKSPLWQEERRKRLTASKFGMVCTKKDERCCKDAVYNILYAVVDNEWTRHGHATEPAALRALRDTFGVRGRRSGVFIDHQYPYLAATPDGLVGDDAIIEVKCPLRAGEFKTPFLAVRNGALPYCAASVNGSIWLKRRALYHYQIQGQLHITRRNKCHFLIYTKQWLHHEIIFRDDHFWNTKMVNKLKKFYMDCLLPEIVDPQYTLRNNTNDIRSGDFITTSAKKAEEVKKRFPHDPAERLNIMRQFENITLIMK